MNRAPERPAPRPPLGLVAVLLPTLFAAAQAAPPAAGPGAVPVLAPKSAAASAPASVPASASALAAEARPRTRAFTPADDARVGTLPPGVGVAPGLPGPDARVRDVHGAEVGLHGLAPGPLLLVFYRGGWCPYCNHQLHALAQAWPEFQRRGVMVAAISVDRIEAAAATHRGFDIPFPLLSDPDLTAHRAWRVVHQADDVEVARLASYGIDLEGASGRKHHRFGVPSIFYLDAQRVVRWAHAEGDYKTRPTVPQVLAALDALQAPAQPAAPPR